MTTWKDLMTDATERTPVMLATATTGLDDDDELLAVAVLAPPWGGRTTPERRLLVRTVPEDLLLKSQRYHQVTAMYMQAHAVSDEAFREGLAGYLDNCEVFTYNSRFQTDFLTRFLGTPPVRELHNLPLLLKLANMHLRVESRDIADVGQMETLAAKSAGAPPTFKKVCDVNAAEPLRPPALPVESAVHQLACLWEKFCAVPVEVQMTLL